MRFWKTAGAVALAAAIATSAVAQPKPAALPDPEANIVEELVVVARHPAPAWWRVERGGSTVWIRRVRLERTSESSFPNRVTISAGMSAASRPRSKSDSNSLQEPIEYHKKRQKSGSEPRPVPSAMFEGMEITALRI